MINAGIHKPDAIILDLEDSVTPSDKNAARLIVRNALRTLDFFGAERINAMGFQCFYKFPLLTEPQNQ